MNQFVPIGQLAESLWDGRPPDGVRATLRSHVSRVRTTLASAGGGDHGVALRTVSGGYRLTGDPELVDIHRFRDLVLHAMALADPAERTSHLLAALDLWQGPPFADVASARLREQLSAGLEDQHLAALERLGFDSLMLGHPALPALGQAATANPGHENLAMLYMRVLCQSGRRTAALDVYVRTRKYLNEEYGIDPGEALRALYRAILQDALPPLLGGDG